MNATSLPSPDPSEPSDFDLSVQKQHGYRMVVMEMSLAICGIVFNLVVLISIREKEWLLNNTSNVLLANLCFANLVSAVFVKSIAVIYNGYAVAATLWEVELAFCSIHTISFRATWAVFPYSLVVLCWLGLFQRSERIFKSKSTSSLNKGDSSNAMAKHSYRTATVAVIETLGSNDGDDQHHGMDMDGADSGSLQLAPAGVSLTGTKQSSIEVLSAAGASLAVGGQLALGGEEVGEGTLHHQESASEEPIEVPHGLIEDEEEVAQGLTGRQKGMLGFIWVVSAAYAMFSKEILSKERFVPCSVRHDLTEKMNLVSFFVAVAVPTLAGPVLCPIVHLVLTFCHCCCLPCVGSRAIDAATANAGSSDDDEETQDTCSMLADFGLILSMSAVFLVVYPTHMYVVEVYLATIETHFLYMAFKYCFGCLHLVLLPLLILILRQDIRRAAIDVLLKRGTQSSSEVNFEQKQRNLKQ